MRRPVLMISLLVAGAGMLLTGALPAAAAVPAVGTGTTSVHLTPGANPGVVGVPVAFTVAVTALTGNMPPTGTVTFMTTGGAMATTSPQLTAVQGSTTASTASTTVTFSLPTNGTDYTVSATYSGDATFAANVSNPVNEAVTAAAPATTPASTTPATTPASTTPAAGVTTPPAAVVAPGATVYPVGAVGTGGGGSLGGGVNAALVAAGSLAVLAGAGLGGLAWRRRRHSS